MAIEIVDKIPLEMVIFHSYVNVYQRVPLVTLVATSTQAKWHRLARSPAKLF